MRRKPRIMIIREQSLGERGQPLVCASEVAAEINKCLEAEGDTKDQEHTWVVCLDNKHRVAAIALVGLGGWTSCPIDQKVVLCAVLVRKCPAFILVHNHPSGDLAMSREDSDLLERMNRSATIVGLRMLDFLIVGHGRFFSAADAGTM